MASRTFKYAALALNILERLLGSRFTVSGLENLPKHPILFVGNHFTRSETFFIPYIIHKHTRRQVRCLADSGLYHGVLGKFLNSVGTISTKNANRDNIILKDLITGDYDWMIYPEGSMIKSKEIKRESSFVSYTPYGVGNVRTGSAVLALKAELYRQDLIDAFKKNKEDLLNNFKVDLGVDYEERLKEIHTYIVPVNITYYPIRPGDNSIKKFASKLVKRMPRQVAEELEIEGNILLDAEININFGKPVNLADYIKAEKNLIYQIPIIKNETKTNFILKYFRHRLTNDFMEKIYFDAQINFDHLFSATLFHSPKNKITKDHLKRVIYLSAIMLRKIGKYRLHQSIFEDNLIKMFLDEPHESFDSVFKLAKLQNLVSENGDIISISKELLNKKYDFHEIRKENTLQVVLNEFFLLATANNIVKRNDKIAEIQLKKKVFTEIRKRDLEIFNNDYQIYFDDKFSKDKQVGSPLFLDLKPNVPCKIKKTGILVCHGYKSAPKEVEALAKFFNGFGFMVYSVRLQGHGTSPINLKDVTWQDWYDSVQRGYAALRNHCSKVFMIGFSTGGLLTLLSASKKQQHLAGIAVVNSALKLRDIRTRMVPGINIWNELLEKLHIEKGKFEYVDDVPENPDINYSRNYLRGVEQLENLMKECENNLDKIHVPSLIIQSKNDPIVNSVSGDVIYKKIKSEQKFLIQPDFKNHVIINGENKEEVFESIREFLHKLKLL
ncbi:MAG: alpha/beta fold hydrolase [Pelagibacterales bacterium]|nr:alpha/beta fold hydrolase [Pelagibacterales bacterium]